MPSNREQALPAGTLIESFEIRRVIGTGGFGVTYLGFDTSLERPVAIKEYCPAGIAQRAPGDTTLQPGEPELEEQYSYGLNRFLDEARVLARFHHPSIVNVHRFLEANGTGYLIMDMEQGQTLWRVLRRSRTLGEAAILGLLVPLLEGLEVVHSQNYMHRDIKPPNIFLRDKGAPVLLDFGSARQALEQQGGQLTVMVTPGYAPVEQYSASDQQGPWSDLYALGATVYHCMVGEAPMTATDRIARVHAGEPDPVATALSDLDGGYSERMVDCVLWMMDPVAARRPQSTADVLAELRTGDTPIPLTTAGNAGSLDAIDTGNRFDATPELTRALQNTLERHAGKVARKVVAPAVSRATNFDELVEHLAGFVLDPDHQNAFREQAIALRQTTTPPDSEAPSRPATTQSLTDEVVAFARSQLAEFVGPIAAVLVEDALGQATSRDEFHAMLAEELDDLDERKAFLQRVQ